MLAHLKMCNLNFKESINLSLQQDKSFYSHFFSIIKPNPFIFYPRLEQFTFVLTKWRTPVEITLFHLADEKRVAGMNQLGYKSYNLEIEICRRQIYLNI